MSLYKLGARNADKKTPNLISTDSINLEYVIILSSKFYFFIIYKEKQHA